MPVMRQWKLATVLFAATVTVTIVCLIGAGQLWVYPFPRTAYLGAAYYFGIASAVFFAMGLFLDDLSEWFVKRLERPFNSLIRVFFTFIFTAMMLLALVFVLPGARYLMSLERCSSQYIDPICTKTEANLSEKDRELIMKTDHFQDFLNKNRLLRWVFDRFDG